jgi:hypothetical protein
MIFHHDGSFRLTRVSRKIQSRWFESKPERWVVAPQSGGREWRVSLTAESVGPLRSTQLYGPPFGCAASKTMREPAGKCA